MDELRLFIFFPPFLLLLLLLLSLGPGVFDGLLDLCALIGAAAVSGSVAGRHRCSSAKCSPCLPLLPFPLRLAAESRSPAHAL